MLTKEQSNPEPDELARITKSVENLEALKKNTIVVQNKIYKNINDGYRDLFHYLTIATMLLAIGSATFLYIVIAGCSFFGLREPIKPYHKSIIALASTFIVLFLFFVACSVAAYCKYSNIKTITKSEQTKRDFTSVEEAFRTLETGKVGLDAISQALDAIAKTQREIKRTTIDVPMDIVDKETLKNLGAAYQDPWKNLFDANVKIFNYILEYRKIFPLAGCENIATPQDKKSKNDLRHKYATLQPRRVALILDAIKEFTQKYNPGRIQSRDFATHGEHACYVKKLRTATVIFLKKIDILVCPTKTRQLSSAIKCGIAISFTLDAVVIGMFIAGSVMQKPIFGLDFDSGSFESSLLLPLALGLFILCIGALIPSYFAIQSDVKASVELATSQVTLSNRSTMPATAEGQKPRIHFKKKLSHRLGVLTNIGNNCNTGKSVVKSKSDGRSHDLESSTTHQDSDNFICSDGGRDSRPSCTLSVSSTSHHTFNKNLCNKPNASDWQRTIITNRNIGSAESSLF